MFNFGAFPTFAELMESIQAVNIVFIKKAHCHTKNMDKATNFSPP